MEKIDRHRKIEHQPVRLREGINRLIFNDGQLFYVYVPIGVLENAENARLLVSVHGYSGRTNTTYGRNRARKQIEYWSDLAQSKKWVILAPHFDKDRFNDDYQRLNLNGLRADIRLNRMIDVIDKQLPGLYTGRFFLFGFSGGGQFVHRYCAFHPDRVERAVAGASGWYLWPDRKIPYPVGLNLDHYGDGIRIRFREFCNLRLLILVGYHDSVQGTFKIHHGEYNLVDLQGRGRRERAKRWFDLVCETASKAGYPFNMTFRVILRTAHKVNGHILEEAGNFLQLF